MSGIEALAERPGVTTNDVGHNGKRTHVAPETPGSIHEGGELGYSLSHAFGAVFDNPDLIAATSHQGCFSGRLIFRSFLIERAPRGRARILFA